MTLPLLTVRQEGLFCPLGGFYIDPLKPVGTAVLTHAHGDHCRQGMGSYLCHDDSVGIVRSRLPSAKDSVRSVPYDESLKIGDVNVTLFPAGHILGSAQVLIEHEGVRWLVSGDYKRQADPTTPAYRVVPCDVFVTEATFGLPIYRWPDTEIILDQIVDWWEKAALKSSTAILYAYSLGKTQRILFELADRYGDKLPGPVVLHPAAAELTQIYSETLNKDISFKTCESGHKLLDQKNALVIAPPSAEGGKWIKSFGKAQDALASGWMTLRGSRRRRGVDQGFIISDHADWDGLIETCRASEASKIFVTHGYDDSLARFLNEAGVDATPLGNLYEGGGD
ncbi:MAG: DNA ligase-associated DEXH box helicase [Actinobacteria bacterium]|nr:DNA ligase-associated DEXH box helicase [Actinomycetota bacterium]